MAMVIVPTCLCNTCAKKMLDEGSSCQKLELQQLSAAMQCWENECFSRSSGKAARAAELSSQPPHLAFYVCSGMSEKKKPLPYQPSPQPYFFFQSKICLCNLNDLSIVYRRIDAQLLLSGGIQDRLALFSVHYTVPKEA